MNVMKKASVYSVVINILFFILFASLLTSYIKEVKNLSVVKDSYIESVNREIQAHNLLDTLVVSGWLKEKMSNVKVEKGVYYVQWDPNKKKWVLMKNKDVVFDDILDNIQRMNPIEDYFVIKIYPPGNVTVPDFVVESGDMKEDIVISDSCNLLKDFLPNASDSICDGEFHKITIKHPYYYKLKVKLHNNYNDSMFFSSNVMILKDNPQHLQEIITYAKNNVNELVVTSSQIICDNKDLRAFFKKNFNAECVDQNKKFVFISLFGPMNITQKGKGLNSPYLIPLYKGLLLYHPLYNLIIYNGDWNKLSKEERKAILFTIYSYNYCPYSHEKYTKWFSYTLYGKINKSFANYIGEESYTHLYTKNTISKIEIEYLIKKD